MKSKYVIVEDAGIEVPVVFSPLIQHERFACFKPISAGFCRINTIVKEGVRELSVDVWGSSVSLGLRCRPAVDEEIIERLLEYSI